MVGKQLRDPEAVARAAIATTEGRAVALGEPGSVNAEVVAALRRSLDRLPRRTATCAAGPQPSPTRTLRHRLVG